MSIIHAVICRGKETALVEYTTASGTFPQIARELLKVVDTETKQFIPYNDKYVFHYINENDFTYMCLTDAHFSKKNSFGFLTDLKERFLNTFTYDQRMGAINYSLNNAFAETIKKLMNQYSSDLEDDKLTQLKHQINDLKNITAANIDNLIQRQNRIELLVRTTSSMNVTANNMKQQAGQIRRETYLRSIRVKLIVGAAAAVGTLGFILLV
ncbi:hypothetical protein ABPG74_010197 [Tetrahymena malaccensis]